MSEWYGSYYRGSASSVGEEMDDIYCIPRLNIEAAVSSGALIIARPSLAHVM